MASDLQRRKERAALASILASSGLAAAKGVAALSSGSLALMTDALHGLADVAATVLTWFAVRLGGKPADAEHPFGHGKVESVAALIEVGLLVAIAGFALAEALSRLGGGGAEATISWLAIGVVLVSIVVDVWRVAVLKRVAAETGSHALEADALHFSSDLWTSGAVLVGFAGVALGYPQADAVAAIAVAGVIVATAWSLGRRTVLTLIDTAPDGAAERAAEAVRSLPGVVAIEGIRLRQTGAAIDGDITIAVPRTLAPDRIMALKARVDLALKGALPRSTITVTANPRALDDETILERVLLIAAARRVPVHHVTVQTLDGTLAIALDVEVDGRLSLDAAHVIATRIEAAIREDLGADTEVETHIEPLEPRGLPGHPASEDDRSAVLAAIARLAPAHPAIADVHDVRVRETPRGRLVVLHATLPGRTTVADAHAAVDVFERALAAACPGVARVVTHAEPDRRAGET